MKFYKPQFSIIIIIIQLILSVIAYFDFVEWGIDNPELDGLINRHFLEHKLFLFVLIIGLYEMINKPSLLKILLRIFLVCILIGTQILVTFHLFYNAAWFTAIVLLILILIQFGIYIYKNINSKSA